MYCEYCGKYQEDGTFCEYCGRKVTEGDPPRAEINAPANAYDDHGQQYFVPRDRIFEKQQPDNAYPMQRDIFDDYGQKPFAAKKDKTPIIVAVLVGVCVLCIGTAVSFALIFGGKNNKTDEPPTAAPVQPEDTFTENAASAETAVQSTAVTDETEPESEPEPEPVIDHTGWQQAYLDKAYEVMKLLYDSPAELYFCLYDINGDGFDELYIQSTDAGAYYTRALCTYGNGELTELAQEGMGYFRFNVNNNGVRYYAYPSGNDGVFYRLEDNRLVEYDEASDSTLGCFDLENHTDSFEEFAGSLGADIPKDYEELKKSVIIPASTLMTMTRRQLLDRIGNDYRASWHEYENKNTDGYVCGITSDKYFPGVVLEMYDGDLYSAEDVLAAFNGYSDDQMFYWLSAHDGALVGDNAYIGMRYSEILVLIDSLGGVDSSGSAYHCMVDGTEMIFYFDAPSDLEKIESKVREIYGSESGIVDGRDIDPVCTMATTMGGYGGHMSEAAATQKAALCTAPHSGASILWYLEKDETIAFFGDGLPNDEWILGFYYTPEGVLKIGYIKTEFLRLTRSDF